MITVYHGSLERVETPEIRPSNRTLDYGSGFYTTTSYEQAEAWVKRRMEEHKAIRGYVNEYTLNKDCNMRQTGTLYNNRGIDPRR